jgi:hypothetical protein
VLVSDSRAREQETVEEDPDKEDGQNIFSGSEQRRVGASLCKGNSAKDSLQDKSQHGMDKLDGKADLALVQGHSRFHTPNDDARDALAVGQATDMETAVTKSSGAIQMGEIIEELDDDAGSKISYYAEDELTGKIRKLQISKYSTTYVQMQQIIVESKRLLGSEYERQLNDLDHRDLWQGGNNDGKQNQQNGFLVADGLGPKEGDGNRVSLPESRVIETHRNRSLEMSDLSLEQ